jgi:hypothetical protein
MPFCTKCGSATTQEAKFCNKCGNPIRAKPAGQEPPTVLTQGPLVPEPPADDAGSALTTVLPPTVLPPTVLPSRVPGEEDAPTTITPPQPAPPWSAGPPPAPPRPATAPAAESPGPPTFVSPPGSWPPAQPPRASAGAAGPGVWPTAQPERPIPDPTEFRPVRPPGQDVPRPPRPPDRPGSGRQGSGRSATWIGFAVAAVLVLGGGGFAAWKFLGHHTPHHPSAAGSATAPANGTGPGASKSPAASSPTPSPPPSTPAGFPVKVAPSVAAQSGEPQVVAFLQTYFTAINKHNYGQYAPLLVPSLRPTSTQFQNGFSSTADSAAMLTGINPNGAGLAANVRFTSHQSPSQSPTSTGCDAWRITLFLQPHGSGYRIGPAVPGYHAHYRAC